LMARAVAAAQALGFPITEDFNGSRTDGFGMPDFTIRNGRRCSTADAYLRPALHRSNLEVRTGALVERVRIVDGRAVGVVVRMDGPRRSFTATREIILAGGAINSPQLLMLSGIGPAAHLRAHGITPLADSPDVGRNLMDH